MHFRRSGLPFSPDRTGSKKGIWDQFTRGGKTSEVPSEGRRRRTSPHRKPRRPFQCVLAPLFAFCHSQLQACRV